MLAITGDIIIPAVVTAVGSIFVAWLRLMSQRQRRAADAIGAQLRPNGGSSLRDAVDQTNRTVAALAVEFASAASRRDEQIAALDRTLKLHCAESAERHRRRSERISAIEHSLGIPIDPTPPQGTPPTGGPS